MEFWECCVCEESGGPTTPSIETSLKHERHQKRHQELTHLRVWKQNGIFLTCFSILVVLTTFGLEDRSCAKSFWCKELIYWFNFPHWLLCCHTISVVFTFLLSYYCGGGGEDVESTTCTHFRLLPFPLEHVCVGCFYLLAFCLIFCICDSQEQRTNWGGSTCSSHKGSINMESGENIFAFDFNVYSLSAKERWTDCFVNAV